VSAIPLRRRLGPLVERDYRLYFSAVSVSTLGDAVAGIALVFAVLKLTGNRAIDVGYVLGARQVANAAMVLLAGVIADRVPRNRVLVGASLVQAAAQAATAVVILSGDATLGLVIALQLVYGAADGFIIPRRPGSCRRRSARRGCSRRTRSTGSSGT